MKKHNIILLGLVGVITIITMCLAYKLTLTALNVRHSYQYIEQEIKDEEVIIWKNLNINFDYFSSNIYNKSMEDIYVVVYENDVIKEETLYIPAGGEKSFENEKGLYSIEIHGKNVTPEDVFAEATRHSYFKEFRKTVLVCAVLLAICTCMLMLFYSKYSEKIYRLLLLIIGLLSTLSFVFGVKECFVFVMNWTMIYFFAENIAIIICKEDTNKEDIHEANALVPALAGLIISGFFMKGCLNSTPSSLLYVLSSEKHMSLITYVLTIVIFVIITLLLLACQEKNNRLGVILKKIDCSDTYWGILCIALVRWIQLEELSVYKNLNRFIFLFVLFVLGYFIVERELIVIPQWIAYVIGVVVIVVSAVSMTIINNFYMGHETWSMVHHLDHYYRPMYYVANNIPFPEGDVNMYGHYAIFYKMPMLLFGANLRTLGVFTGFLGGLTAFFTIGTIYKLCKNAKYRLVGELLILYVFTSHIYIAIMPHRLLFPCGMMYFIACNYKKEKSIIDFLIGLCISLVSIVWNTETGAVVLMTFLVYVFAKFTSKKNHWIKSLIKLVVLKIIPIVCVLLLLLGVSVRLKLFGMDKLFGVIFDVQYMTSNHLGKLYMTNSLWIYILAIFLLCIGEALNKIGLFADYNDKEHETVFIIPVSLLGLGMMVYYISRPEDYSIILLFAMVLVVIIISRINNKEMKCLLVCASFSIFLFYGFAYNNFHLRVVEQGLCDYETMETDIQDFKESVIDELYEDGIFVLNGSGLYEVFMDLDLLVSDYDKSKYFIDSTLHDGDTPISQANIGDQVYYIYRINK